jgi:hypothetical protein
VVVSLMANMTALVSEHLLRVRMTR